VGLLPVVLLKYPDRRLKKCPLIDTCQMIRIEYALQENKMDDKYYLKIAIDLARESAEKGGDPFGAILVYKDNVVAKSTDRSVEKSDPTYHAELSLIREYCQTNKIFSLEGHTLFSSTEPCIMCAGAIKSANIPRVVFSVSQAVLRTYSGGRKKPGCESLVNSGNRRIEVVGPLLPDEGKKVFEEFPLIPKAERHHRLFQK
jgi:tRNA(Arg) A34 adenosine deaminase TadA